MSAPVPLMTGTALSDNSGIPAFVDNPVSCAQVDGKRKMSSALAGPVPGGLVGQKSSISFPNSKKAGSLSSSHRHSHPECPMRPLSLSLWPKLFRP